jgi:N-terminal domain of galactosyltransferase
LHVLLRLLYPEFFGGVTAMRGDHFEKLNGFPNQYYGWGGEDDELWYRLVNISLL